MLDDLNEFGLSVTLIKIAGGTYKPSSQSSVFTISRPVSIRGGFKGTGVDADTQDIETFVTTVSGDLGNNDAGTQTSMSDNAWRLFVVESYEESIPTSCEGITFTGGNAIIALSGGTAGGAIFSGAPLILERCIFRGNSGINGGAVHCGSHELKVRACDFESNGAPPPVASGDWEFTGSGGAIYAGGPVTVVRSRFIGNRYGRSSLGGAMFITRVSDADARVTNCVFIGNSVGSASEQFSSAGGAIRALRDPLEITGSVFAGNKALGSTGSSGGAISTDGWSPSDLQLRLCTIADNETSGSGGGVFCENVSISNSIVYGNTGGTGTTFMQQVDPISMLSIEYSCVEAIPLLSFPTGNISADPEFTASGSQDYSLQGGSPAIDAGSNAQIPPDVTDVDDNPSNDGDPLPEDVVRQHRVLGCVVDMGAFEWGCVGDANGDGTVDGSDLAAVLGNWGTCGSTPCTGDLNCDSVVNGADMAIVLGNWGVCSGGDEMRMSGVGEPSLLTPAEFVELLGLESIDELVEWLTSLDFTTMSNTLKVWFGA